MAERPGAAAPTIDQAFLQTPLRAPGEGVTLLPEEEVFVQAQQAQEAIQQRAGILGGLLRALGITQAPTQEEGGEPAAGTVEGDGQQEGLLQRVLTRAVGGKVGGRGAEKAREAESQRLETISFVDSVRDLRAGRTSSEDFLLEIPISFREQGESLVFQKLAMDLRQGQISPVEFSQQIPRRFASRAPDILAALRQERATR